MATLETDYVLNLKTRLVDKIATSSQARTNVLKTLLRLGRAAPQSADVAIVLGTSPNLFPDKFRTRIDHACGLLESGKVEMLIFTGSRDNQSKDQASWAIDYATQKHGVKEYQYCSVGGVNTEQNFREARDEIRTWYSWIKSVLVISESFHLIRAVSLAKSLFGGYQIEVSPSPVDGFEVPNQDDPKVIRELIKAVAYNHTIARPLTPTLANQLRPFIDNLVAEYEAKLFPKSQVI